MFFFCLFVNAGKIHFLDRPLNNDIIGINSFYIDLLTINKNDYGRNFSDLIKKVE